jgi:hypothetical protein
MTLREFLSRGRQLFSGHGFFRAEQRSRNLAG